MRIVTWNIHGWKSAANQLNMLTVGDVLSSINADIIGLNEVYYPRVIEGSSKPALDALAERLGMHVVFGACLRWPVQDEMPANAYGNALLSRWPILASSAHHLTAKEEDSGNLLDSKEQRGLLEGRILLPDSVDGSGDGDSRSFTVYVTHLDHTDEDARTIQFRVARTWLGRDRNRPHILMGDFNAITRWDFTERSGEWETIARHEKGKNLLGSDKGPRLIDQVEKSGYVDLHRRFAIPGERSFLASESAIRIDYIFASQSLAAKVSTCRIYTDADGVSDHRPVIAEIKD